VRTSREPTSSQEVADADETGRCLRRQRKLPAEDQLASVKWEDSDYALMLSTGVPPKVAAERLGPDPTLFTNLSSM
jgi:hypothetical protein